MYDKRFLHPVEKIGKVKDDIDICRYMHMKPSAQIFEKQIFY